jgi:hypothetical protein
MQSFSLVKVFFAVSMFAFVPLACGEDESNPKPSPSDGGESNAGGSSPGRGGEPASGGSGAALGGAPMLPPGISDEPSTIPCAESCDSARVGALGQFVHIDPCCAGAEEACGLNTQFLDQTGATFGESCQPKNQPGELDESCPATAAGSVPFGAIMVPLNPFPGCCRPNGTCGVQVNEIVVMIGPEPSSVGDLSLGCVDAEPFFPGVDPVPCGDGAGGGGNAGAGGAPGAGGADGAGGASGGASGAGGGE